MGRRIIQVDFGLLLSALCRDDRASGNQPWPSTSFVICDGIPKDARIIDIRANSFAAIGQAEILLESAEWAEKHHCGTVERISPQFTWFTDYATFLKMQGGLASNVVAQPPKPMGREFI